VIEQNAIHSPGDEIGVGVDVVVIGDGDYPIASLRVEKKLVSHRRAEGRDLVICEVRQLPVSRRIGRSDREHFTKLEVWNRYGMARAQLGAILESRESDVEISALDRGFE
jgi:hypothetical protein